jgi:preprotein translocase subunit YajC
MSNLAQAQEQSSGRGMELAGLIPLVLIGVVFYFFLIRPQQRKEKQRLGMIASLSRGDRVVTNGGLIGTVYRISKDEDLVLELAEGVQVSVRRNAIAEVLVKVGGVSLDDKPTAKPEEAGKTKKARASHAYVNKSAKKKK